MLVKSSRTCWRPGTWELERGTQRAGECGGSGRDKARALDSEEHWQVKWARDGQPGPSPGIFLDRSPKSGFIPRRVSALLHLFRLPAFENRIVEWIKQCAYRAFFYPLHPSPHTSSHPALCHGRLSRRDLSPARKINSILSRSRGKNVAR